MICHCAKDNRITVDPRGNIRRDLRAEGDVRRAISRRPISNFKSRRRTKRRNRAGTTAVSMNHRGIRRRRRHSEGIARSIISRNFIVNMLYNAG